MRLKRPVGADESQEKVFNNLIPMLAATTAWKAAGIESGMEYQDFHENVRPGTYDDFVPEIERMKRGEPDVLWPGTCRMYVHSPGIRSAVARTVPMTEPMLRHFKDSGLESILWYTARVGNCSVFRGRHLFLGGSTVLTPIPDAEPSEAFTCDLSGIGALNLPGWVKKSYYEPGSEIAQIADWNEKIAAITERTAGADISLLAGFPGWVLLLAESLLAKGAAGKGRAKNLQEMWPHLQCFMHGGVPIAPFQDELRSVLGPTVNFHEVYEASEGVFAAQDADAGAGLRMMADAGIFFEFLAMSDYDPARIHSLGSKLVPISGVKAGVDYALILTTPAGLVRYVIGDVVRFTSTEPPRITYVGRTGLRLNAFGEGVTEREVTDALIAVCRRNGWNIVNFHVAPFYSPSTVGQARCRHEWWVELKPGTSITPTGPIIGIELDVELKRLNPEYASRRNGGSLEAPFVRLVMPGVFEHWMRHHGKWEAETRCPAAAAIASSPTSSARSFSLRKIRQGWHGRCCKGVTCAKQGFG